MRRTKRRPLLDQTVAGAGASNSGNEPSWPLRTKLGPLPVSAKNVHLLWLMLIMIGSLPIVFALGVGRSDWSSFWSAGGTVGGPNLMDYQLHSAWQIAHGVLADPWRYPPAFAYLYWPPSLLPQSVGFAINTGLMLALLGLAGLLLVRIFDLPKGFAVFLAFAWTPALEPIVMGQNAGLALVLALWAIDALRRESDLEAGLALGLLMYKPTLGLPLLGFLLLRARWRSFSVASLVTGAGYVLSVAAAGGDWAWPLAWWNGTQAFFVGDLIFNADKTISVPGLLSRIPGVPLWFAYLGGGVIVLLALRGLARAHIVEAASAACLIALVAGPRVWSYETGLMLPILAWAAAGGVDEPWRTRLIHLAIPVGFLWWLSPLTTVSGVAVVVIVATALWLWRWRPWGPNPLVGTSKVVRQQSASAPLVADLSDLAVTNRPGASAMVAPASPAGEV